MDVITDFSTSLNFEKVQFDCILVVVNQLTKITHFISITKKLISEKLVHLFVHKIVRLHELSFTRAVPAKLYQL
ncbi:hypothetical protein CIRG_04118 [Coccidioides immitis RMSCC 2394]|uniref:Uncharacterized protein n=1 Tax=Coccidioides immitis RMSCC 2394 TaxID=404692 RepID=A0A0J6Y6Y1_COCIT|nr:hypothetical protein CIRG_04118 [Coccidioides immitis RMSCC 2394]